MATSIGWYLIGPLVAVALVGFLGAIFWRIAVREEIAVREATEQDAEGLTIFAEPDDYGLLCPAAIADDATAAGEIRRRLGQAGIRATQAIGRDGRTAVLVFAEEVEVARRLVGDSPAL